MPFLLNLLQNRVSFTADKFVQENINVEGCPHWSP